MYKMRLTLSPPSINNQQIINPNNNMSYTISSNNMSYTSGNNYQLFQLYKRKFSSNELTNIHTHENYYQS